MDFQQNGGIHPLIGGHGLGRLPVKATAGHSPHWSESSGCSGSPILLDHKTFNLKLYKRDSGIISWEALFANQDTLLSQPKPHGGQHSGYPGGHLPEYDTLMAAFRNLLDRYLHVVLIDAGPLDATKIPEDGANPTFRHARIRPLTKSDLTAGGPSSSPLEVVLSPSGTRAFLKPAEQIELSSELASQCVEEWSFLFGTSGAPVSVSSQQSGVEALPMVVSVAIMSGENEIIIHYPTERIFVPVSLKEAPSDAGGSDGLGSRNLGFIEDLGAKFTTWAWQEKLWNASTLPSVPRLIPPILDHPPVLAEPRNRLKAGSSAWQQQQHNLHQQQLQQQQQQQKQQQQQSIFLQQQLDAYQERDAGSRSGNIDRLDYWDYTDPHGYLTSLVLNNCANADAKILDASPMEQESPAPTAPPLSVTRRKIAREYKKKELEADGWPVVHDLAPSATTPGQNGQWRGDTAPETDQPSDSSALATPTVKEETKQPPAQPDGTSTTTNMTGSNFSLPIDMPNEIPELMDMNPIMRMFGSSNTDDLGDWDTQEITEDDFSFFDEQPRRSRMPVLDPLSSAFDSLSGPLSTGVSLATVAATATLPTAPAIVSQDLGSLSTAISAAIPTTSIPNAEENLESVDSMFMDIEFDMSTFTQPTPPMSGPLTVGPGEKSSSLETIASNTEETARATPSSDTFISGTDTQTPGSQNAATPHPLPIAPPTSSHATPAVIETQSLALQVPTTEIVPSGSRTEVGSTVALIESVSLPMQSLIPRSFSPLRIVSGPSVDDAKYQFGGRFMYKPLFKRRRSYIRDRSRNETALFPISIYGPQYHPGLAVDLSQLDTKIRRKMAAGGVRRPSILSSRRATVIPQLGASSVAEALSQHTAQGAAQPLSNLHAKETPFQLNTIKDEAESDSSSDSDGGDGSNSSDDESADEGYRREPSVGELTFHSLKGGKRRWKVRGINSARMVATAFQSWIHRELASRMFGLAVSLPSTPGERWDVTNHRKKVWASAETYHRESEYDSPFLPVIFSAAPPALVNERTALQEAFAVGYFYDSVRVLCEQAIVGEYPFAESNETVGSSGDVSEGQSFHVMLARRRTMADTIFEGIPSVPALCDDSLRKMMEIRAAIFQVLEQLRGNQNDTPALPVPSEAAQEMGIASIHHQHAQNNMGSTVTMKGPLSLSQYSSLAEVQPTPTKYGKFQVKKKKPAEPSLFQMTAPDIVVGHNDEWLEASPSILRFWEKLSLEPYSAKKNIFYYVLYPEGADMENAVVKFWKELSSLFETSLLGQHVPGDVPDGKPGLYPVPLLLPGETQEAHRVRSLVEGSRKLGTLLGSSNRKDAHIAVYMVNPFNHGASYFELARCFSVLKGSYNASLPISQSTTAAAEQQERLVLQMVPIHHVLYPAAFGGFLRFGLRQMAFSVYQRCKVALERSSQTSKVEAQASVYAPAFALAKTAPTFIHYSLHLKPNTVPRAPATMHVAYTLSMDERWLVCVWTDHRGEMLEHLALDLKGCRHGLGVSVVTTTASRGRVRRKEQESRKTRWTFAECMREVWTKTLLYQKRASFSWKTVITKLGLISLSELAEWTRIIKDAHNVSIVAVNIESPMRLYPFGRSVSEGMTSGMTPAGSGVTTPNPSGMLSQGIPSISTPNLNSSTTTPLPNISTMPSTPGSTPTPSTPMSGGTLGVNGILGGGLGLGIAGASSMGISGGIGYPSATTTGSASGAAGIAGGDSFGSEVLENGASQMYGMVPGHDTSVMLLNPRLFSNDAPGPTSTSASPSSSATSSSSTSASATPTSKLVAVKTEENEDHLMSEDTKMEDDTQPSKLSAPALEQAESTSSTDQSSSKEEPPSWMTLSGNEIVLPLATGYLMQVPIQSSTVIRERHCVESVGVEVHLVAHMGHPSQDATVGQQQSSQQQRPQQRLPSNTNPNSPGPTSASPYYGHQSSPYTSSSSPSLSSYSGSSMVNGGGVSGGAGSSAASSTATGSHAVSLGIASTSSLNILRDLLKQFHALSHLTLASVPTNCLPLHLVLLERLSRVLLLVKD
ncbi:mediator of RNA polymerase II transcription subunit 13 [Actinomortierella ambigua]|nr:mediator of RNA polymerase II transcription subunit 13 [Actinomortierella ambigua]